MRFGLGTITYLLLNPPSTVPLFLHLSQERRHREDIHRWKQAKQAITLERLIQHYARCQETENAKETLFFNHFILFIYVFIYLILMYLAEVTKKKEESQELSTV